MVTISNITDPEAKDFTIGHPATRVSADVRREILSAIANIGYGSVEVIIHDGKVVQIERREKIRVTRHGCGC